MIKKVLIIKLSSLGDVLHLLPALTDAKAVYPHIQFDWVVDESFQEIPAWHPAVAEVYPFPLRRLRRQHPWTFYKKKDFKNFAETLSHRKYDLIIDAQGLIKSALVSLIPQGPRAGFSRKSAREPLAALCYQKRYFIPPGHAITKLRQLLATALEYALPSEQINYGLSNQTFPQFKLKENAIIALHGTTWPTKLWPESHWHEITKMLTEKNHPVYFPWGNLAEKERAEKITRAIPNAYLLPASDLSTLAGILQTAQKALAVDTGLGHLAAALGTPCLSLYGPTNPNRTGTKGQNQRHLTSQLPCAPCLKATCSQQKRTEPNHPPCLYELTPNEVMAALLNT